jgi:preprotein translocase subunit YajC
MGPFLDFFLPDAAWAMAPSPPGGGSGSSQLMPTLVMFAAMFAIFYFLMIRPQQKQRQERERMLGAIKRGDKIVTTGGLFGTVTNLTDKTVTLRVADQVKLEFERGAIARRVEEVQGEKDA